MTIAEFVLYFTMFAGLAFYVVKIDSRVRNWVGKLLKVKLKNGRKGIWVLKSKETPKKKAAVYVALLFIQPFVMLIVMGSLACLGILLFNLVNSLTIRLKI